MREVAELSLSNIANYRYTSSALSILKSESVSEESAEEQKHMLTINSFAAFNPWSYCTLRCAPISHPHPTLLLCYIKTTALISRNMQSPADRPGGLRLFSKTLQTQLMQNLTKDEQHVLYKQCNPSVIK